MSWQPAACVRALQSSPRLAMRASCGQPVHLSPPLACLVGLFNTMYRRARSESKSCVTQTPCVCVYIVVVCCTRLALLRACHASPHMISCIALLSSLIAAHSHLCVYVCALPLCAACCRDCFCSPLDCFASYTRTRTPRRCAPAKWCVRACACLHVSIRACVCMDVATHRHLRCTLGASSFLSYRVS